MSRRLLSSGSSYEIAWGYSQGVVQSPWIFMSGIIGYDRETKILPADAAEQTRNAWRNIERFLREADASLRDIVRVTYYVVEGVDFDPILAVCGEVLKDIRPAASLLVISRLAAPDAKVEIEVTALKAS